MEQKLLVSLPTDRNQTVEASLSEELLKLSVTKRTDIQEEIHGVRCLATVETNELISKGLLEFDIELMIVIRKRKEEKKK
jgi:hypothetical protein